MFFSAKADDYDYTVHNSSGIVGIDKEGKRHLISEEEYQKAHPEHSTVGCKECIFVSDKQNIFVFNIDRQLKQTAGYDPVFVGKFTMPRWVGHSGFYLFKCKRCHQVCVDYVHGNNPRIGCSFCEFGHYLNPIDHAEILKREGYNFTEKDVEYYKKYIKQPSLAKFIFVRISILCVLAVIFYLMVRILS